MPFVAGIVSTFFAIVYFPDTKEKEVKKMQHTIPLFITNTKIFSKGES